jgi:hypothetical protein
VWQGRRQIVKNDHHLPAHGIAQRRAATAVGDMHKKGLGQVFEQLHLQMPNATRA